jgi:uncharacterized membrane protein
MTSAALFVVLLIGLASLFKIAQALLLSFDCSVLLYLSLVAVLMSRATHESMAQRAELQNEGRWVVLVFGLILAGVIVVALYLELHGGKSSSAWELLLASATLLLAWLFVVTIFATQYAHSYYLKSDQGHLGLDFPGKRQPDYWDFMYFSAVLSMTSQVSDVPITSHAMRKVALLHGVVAFFFNVIILAITVNVVAGSL